MSLIAIDNNDRILMVEDTPEVQLLLKAQAITRKPLITEEDILSIPVGTTNAHGELITSSCVYRAVAESRVGVNEIYNNMLGDLWVVLTALILINNNYNVDSYRFTKDNSVVYIYVCHSNKRIFCYAHSDTANTSGTIVHYIDKDYRPIHELIVNKTRIQKYDVRTIGGNLGINSQDELWWLYNKIERITK